MSNNFFMEYFFKKSVSGFKCDCTGNKLYVTTSFEAVEQLIKDACKILKEEDGMITFQVFTGYETIDLLRLYSSWNGNITAVHWKRNSFGNVCETWTDEGLKNTKNTVKQYVIEAIKLFEEKAA